MTRSQFDRKNAFLHKLRAAMEECRVFIMADRNGCLCVYDREEPAVKKEDPVKPELLFKGSGELYVENVFDEARF